MPAPTRALALLLMAAGLHAQAGRLRREDDAGVASTAGAPPTVAAIALSIRSRAVQDSRCYLMSGGAVESFFISEDSPVGSVIGTLSVNGDPDAERGDITLRVQEKGAAVGIAPGTKNLTLLRPLDREERRGPSNVYVNVRCDRRLTADPSFVIPVSVRVWDVNDNAPAWVGAPYRVRLSELTAVGARVLAAARATDADQPGPHATVRYSVLPGPNSEYFGFANELDSVLVVKKPLDYETLHNFTLTLRAEDQGSPPLHNDTQLHVEVLDADDQNPRFTHEHYTAVLPDDMQEGTILATSPGPVSAADQDVGINAPLHYSTTGDNKHLLLIDRDSGQLAATEHLLAITQPATVVIKAVQVDNPDRYALATLTVSRRQSAAAAASVRFTREQYTAAVSEGAAPGTVLLTLHTAPAARDRSPLQFFVSERGFLDKFAINSAGEVVLRRALDYEEQDYYHYQVMVTDGLSNDTAAINITVVNVNEWEPRFRHPQYEFRVESPAEGAAGAAGAGLLPVGKLDVFDGDKTDTVTLSLRGPDADMFYVSGSGAMFLRQEALPALNASVLHVVATAQDSGAPPRQTSVPVIVHVSEQLLQRTGGARLSLVAALACAAAALALALCALLLYMRRSRRSKSTPNPAAAGKPYIAHEKGPSPPAPRSPAPPARPPGPAALAPALGGSGSLQSVSAGASTILANSSSSLDLRDSLPTNAINGNVGARGAQQGGPAAAGAAGQPGRGGGRGRLEPSRRVAHVGPPGRGRGPLGRGVAQRHHPRARQEAQLGRRCRQQGQRGGTRGHQPRSARPHEPHRVLLTHTTARVPTAPPPGAARSVEPHATVPLVVWPARPPVCLLPLNNNKTSKKRPVLHSLPPAPHAYVQPVPVRSLTYAPLYNDVEPRNYQPSFIWNTEYFTPKPTRHYAYAATNLADDSFKGNGILKNHVYEENNNKVVSKKAKKKQMSLTWGPQKLKEKPPCGKSVKFSASTWGPASPGAAQPRDGEYATINPRKLTSRYVRPAVFRRTTLKE